LCGVSAGGFGGTSVVESLLPVMRELGLVSIFWDVNVSSAARAFDEAGNVLDQALPRRIDKMVGELVWMARVLRYGRNTVAMSEGSTSSPMVCTACGALMKQHAEKVDFSPPTIADPVFYGTVQAIHACLACGNDNCGRLTSCGRLRRTERAEACPGERRGGSARKESIVTPSDISYQDGTIRCADGRFNSNGG
jgi:hypothetical protein